jgi:fatty acid desaturase
MRIPEQFRLPAGELARLSTRRDLPAGLQALGHAGAIALATVVLTRLHDTGWALPLTVLLGYLLAFLFAAVHEAAHHTAFRTRWLNVLTGHLAAFVIVHPYEYYRAFHWDHHRHTNDPARDPELAQPLPRTRTGLAWMMSGIPGLLRRVPLLLRHCRRAGVVEPWVPQGSRSRIVTEARCYVAGYACVIAVSIAAQSLAAVWFWLLPLVVGQVFLRPYLLAEHTGCAHTPDMRENTRSIRTNAFVRFFAWNMPYHAEHHAYPVVPFHALPRLHGHLAPHLACTENGYLVATAAVAAHLATGLRERDRNSVASD